MRTLAVLGVLLVAAGGGARADQVTFPLGVDYAVLGAALTPTLHPAADGPAVLWGTRDGCRSVTVRDVRIARSEGRVRITASGRARLGFPLFGVCLAPISWEGQLETLASASIGADWQLRLRDLDSHVY